ncbi:MAG: cupin domain-containing protein [Hyphomonadaceae bacterium]|nr:cupin domain-containing protein [Hyphomonadaceae bacterium]
MNLDDVIHALGLKRHPEGGFYAETHRIPAPDGQRSPGTAIYYALGKGDRSHWHRIDATEIWHFYAGAPLELSLSPGQGVETHILGPDLSTGQRPQVIVPVRHWQSARTTGEWTLVGCTVSPGFEFAGFEMASPDWKPAA